MAYAIMRCKKLASAGSVASALRHCYRDRETPNADVDRTPQNEHRASKSTDEAMGMLRAMLPVKRRKDAVLAVEYLMTASPEWWQTATPGQQDEFFKQSKQWLANKFGKGRIIVATIHRDETSPHLSAFVVPLTADGRLSAKELIGGRAQLSADQTSYAECVQHLGLERGQEGSKARHTTISQYYARVGMPLPQPPVVEVPTPSLMDKAKTLDYGHRVAESVIEQLTPAWNAARAKAGELDQVKRQLSKLSSAAAKAGQRTKAESKRADHYQDVAELFTPAEIEAARERRAELEREQAARERNLELLTEKQRRIDALPGLRHKTAGAEHTFVNHAMKAIERAGGDPDKVEWNKVEGAAAREAVSKNGQSYQSAARAICELSPHRANPASHPKVEAWAKERAPIWQKEYEELRKQRPQLGNDLNLEHPPRA